MTPLERCWYENHPLTSLLVPLSWLFRLLVILRRFAYRTGLLPVVRLPVPVLIVGNISVGGTGKTPLVIWLAKMLRNNGYRPGIICRGYKGQAVDWPLVVTETSDPHLAGDESVLLARRSRCMVVAAPDRAAAARKAIDGGCDIIISDDGLQHYALERDIEIAVIDGERRFGNGHCLPAGPLREPERRLATVDFIVVNGEAKHGEYSMLLSGDEFQMIGANKRAAANDFRGREVHAVAAIGNPGRFFRQLRAMGLTITEHPFPDHHFFAAEDIRFGSNAVVIMTEKDAVKCPEIKTGDYWYLPVDAQPDPQFGAELLRRRNRPASPVART